MLHTLRSIIISPDYKGVKEVNVEMPERIRMSNFDSLTSHILQLRNSIQPAASSSPRMPFLSSIFQTSILPGRNISLSEKKSNFPENKINGQLFNGSFTVNHTGALPTSVTKPLDISLRSNLFNHHVTRPEFHSSQVTPLHDPISKMASPLPLLTNNSFHSSTSLHPSCDLLNPKRHENFASPTKQHDKINITDMPQNYENHGMGYLRHHNRSPSPTDGK